MGKVRRKEDDSSVREGEQMEDRVKVYEGNMADEERNTRKEEKEREMEGERE